MRGIEGEAHALHGVKVRGREHLQHVLRLVGADAVLAGDRAARLDAVLQNLSGDLDGALRLAGHALVVANQRMQVAIAGMEHVANPQPRSYGQVANLPEHFRQPRSRHDAVLHVVVRRHTAHRGERRFAAPPDARALLVIRRDLDGRGTGTPARLLDDLKQRSDLCRRTVELDDQNRVGRREVRMHRGLRRLNRERVHHLDGRRDDARADDRRHRLAPRIDAVERREQRLHALRLAQDPHDDLRRDAERPFGTDEQAEQIRAGRIHQRAADIGDLAVGQDHFERQHVVHREAVLETVRAAGVLGHVAADRADLLARRIGRVVVAVRRDSLRDFEVRHAGLDRHATVGDIDLEHTVEARERDHDAVLGGQRAAGQPGAVAARDKRDALTMAEADNGLDLRRRGRQDHCGRHAPKVRQAVALVGQQLQGLVQNRVGTANALRARSTVVDPSGLLSYMLSPVLDTDQGVGSREWG